MGQFNSSGILKNGKGKQRGYMRNKCDDREEEEMIEEKAREGREVQREEIARVERQKYNRYYGKGD